MIYNKEGLSPSSFLCCLLKTMKLFNKCFICYYLHSEWWFIQRIHQPSGYDWFKINTLIKKFIFQLVAFKIYAIKTAYFFQLVAMNINTGISHWELFLEINWNQKTLKLYTSWVHWKNQWRSTMRKHALLWNKLEYQHCTDIFVKNIFHPFYGTSLFLYSLKYSRKPEVYSCFQRA